MIGHGRGFAAILPLLLVAFAVACNGPRYQKAEAVAEAPAAFAVRVENPRESTEVDFRAPLSGTVSSNGQVQLAFQLNGKVTEVLVEEGDHVRKGQVLARLDDRVYQAQRTQALGATQQASAQLEMLENGSRPEEIAAAQANLDSALAVLDRTSKDLERVQLLFSQGVVSKADIDAVEMSWKQASESVDAASQQLAIARQGPRTEQIDQARAAVTAGSGSVDLASVQLEYTLLRAPMTGTLVARQLEPGQTVLAGSPVLEIANLDVLEIITEIPEGDLLSASIGDQARVTFPARPGIEALATIITVAPKASMQTRAFPVTLAIEQVPQGIVTGMVALVSLSFNENPGGVVVRENAIVDGHVFVVHEGRAVETPVQVLGDRGGLVFVSGVTSTDQVIVNGQHRVADGDAVQVVDALGISEITGLDSEGN